FGRGDTPPSRTFESDVRLGGRPLRIGAEIWHASPDERRGTYRIHCRNATKGLTLCRTRCGPPIARPKRPRIRRRLKTNGTTDVSYRMELSHRIRQRRHAMLAGELIPRSGGGSTPSRTLMVKRHKKRTPTAAPRYQRPPSRRSRRTRGSE